jgi:uncharacterized protein
MKGYQVETMELAFRKFPLNSIRLQPGLLMDRAELNRKYLMSLSSENLLQNHYLEACLWSSLKKPEHIHWGWESPTCQVRGHFLGHWLSAAAQVYASRGDLEIKAKADHIVSELARCQKANGGQWVGSIPEKYLNMVAKGQPVWAPHYTLHKTLMGLWDMYAYANSAEALDILIYFAEWFHSWTGKFPREEMGRILETETGGILEIWADLYSVTKDPKHLELLHRYYHRSLFSGLIKGEDMLTNQHANTTIPEILGAARAWEITGEQQWRDIVEAYWNQAVEQRGTFCTGGQTMGEIWAPIRKQSARLGDKNQEHCTVYNMMRLAEKLLQWTGDPGYADYWERNLYNGILAQQHPKTGMVSYYLPLNAGAVKKWGSPTEDFWCCHGSLVQAHAAHGSCAYYQTAEGLAVCQYIPTEITFAPDGFQIRISQDFDRQTGSTERPDSMKAEFTIDADKPYAFPIDFRIPWWAQAGSAISINGEEQDLKLKAGAFCRLERQWHHDRVIVSFVRKLTTCSLPDVPNENAFMYGPLVLAGLCEDERVLTGDIRAPETMLTPDAEREWATWKGGFRTVGLDHGFRFLPLYEICEDSYQVYFPIRNREPEKGAMDR